MSEVAYKFRIYPTKSQEELLNKTFGCVRFVWNAQVKVFNSYNKTGPNQVVSSKLLKDNPEFSFLNDVSAASLQQKDRDFFEFKNQFFNLNRKKKLGRPQFKKRGKNDSFRLPNQKFSLDQEQNRIRLEKIGKVKVAIDRVIPDDAEYVNVTVSKNRAGEFYVSILTRHDVKLKERTGRSVGIDLGLKTFAVMSDGHEVQNPRWFRKNQVKLKRLQVKLKSKTNKKSNRYSKARIQVAKLHQKIARQRAHHHHTFTKWLVDHYDTICIEDLNVAGMKKLYGKSISDAAFGLFKNMLEYKCNWYGRTLHKVDRFFASTKTCNHCEHKETFGLNVRQWTCSNCGTTHDRDFNAAINILKQGLKDLYDYTSDELTEVIERMNDTIRPLLPSCAVALSRARNSSECV